MKQKFSEMDQFTFPTLFYFDESENEGGRPKKDFFLHYLKVA